MMDFLTSSDDLDHLTDDLLLQMIESDANSQVLDIESCDLLSDVDDFKETGSLYANKEFEQDDANSSVWLQQNFQWNDTSKVPQSLIDASIEVENNNPNLFVNPQSVLPVQSSYQVQTNSHQMTLNSQDGIPIKFNGQNALLTTTQIPQIQYVTVQNVRSDNNAQIGYTVQPVQLCAQQLRTVQSLSTPSQSSPVLVEHLQNRVAMQAGGSQRRNNRLAQPQKHEKVYPKPSYSYSCLIALALKNSPLGHLPVSEIYHFMTYNFPYFKTAPDGWKNSVRHNLSLNKCFNKVADCVDATPPVRKGCLWELNLAKKHKIEDEIVKWRKKDPESVKQSMSTPENLDLMEQGMIGPPGSEPGVKSRTSAKQESHPSIKQERVSAPAPRVSAPAPSMVASATVTHAAPIKHEHQMPAASAMSVTHLTPVKYQPMTSVKYEPRSPVSSVKYEPRSPVPSLKYEPQSPISSVKYEQMSSVKYEPMSPVVPTTLTHLTPMKQEGMIAASTAASIGTVTHLTPVKQQSQASQVCGTPPTPHTPRYTHHQVGTSTSMVDTRSLGQVSPQVNRFDPSLSDLALQTQLWDDDLAIGVSSNSQSTVPASPLASPSHHSNGVAYYGNITYTCTSSPLAASGGQIYNTPPVKRIKLSC